MRGCVDWLWFEEVLRRLQETARRVLVRAANEENHDKDDTDYQEIEAEPHF